MPTPSIPIFCYHDTFDGGSHSLARFREHLDAIREAGYRTITARELVEIVTRRRAPQPGSVVLTFDDGHLSNYLLAAPELEARSMTGVFFAITDFIVPGQARTTADTPAFKLMRDCFKEALLARNYEQFINESEIRDLISRGHEVHAHGRRHQAAFRTLKPRYDMGHPKAHWAAWSIYDRFDPDLPTFSEGSAYVYDGFWPTGEVNGRDEPLFRRREPQERAEFCRADMARSLERMRELNGAEEQYFCWPWGQFDRVSEQALAEAGFTAAFTLERGPNAPGTAPLRLNRIGVGLTKTGAWVRARLAMYRSAAGARLFFKRFRRKPEITHLLYATDSVKLSGGSRQLVNNAVAMAELGHEVTVLVPSDAAIPSALPEAVRVIRCDHFKRTLATAFLLRQLVRELGVDVVHTFHNKAYKAAVAAKAMSPGAFKLFINRGVIFNPNALFGLWARIADGMIVNSFACAESLKRVLVPESRMNVVYNSFIPDGPAPPDPATIREARKKRGVRVLYVGNEAPAKGLDTFLAMAAELSADTNLRDVEFVVAGARTLARFEHLMTPQLRHRLLGLGLLEHDEVLEQMRHADILVLSSRQESLPNVLPEAYHAALPVVCTRAGGVPELVAEGAGGELCEVEDHSCLAAKVAALIPDFERRVAMGRVNRRIVTRLLGNRTKALQLLRVYHGAHLYRPLDLPGNDPDSGAEA